jgi:hypothetical protein
LLIAANTTITSPARSPPWAAICRSAAAVSVFISGGVRVSAVTDCETVKTACIAAGLPVIDSRMVEFATVARLAIQGPMIAVGAPPSPPPYHPFSYAPLAVVAAAYRAAGAEVWNLAPAH